MANCGDHGELAAVGGGSPGVFAVSGGVKGDELFVLTATGGMAFVVVPAPREKVLGSSELNGFLVPGKKFVRFRKKFVRF